MRKVWFVGLCIFLFLLTGCSDKSENSKINDSIKDNYTVSYSENNHDFNSECFVGIININGKMMYLFRNMPESFHFFNDEIEEYDRPLHMGLCMYEYKDSRYCLYKELIGEELEPGYSFYEEKYDKYIVFAENEDSGCIDGVYVYDLDEGLECSIYLNDIVSCTIDKSNIRNLVNVVKMIDKDTLLIRYYNTIIIYDLKSKKSDCIDLKDYPDMESILDEKVEYNYYNGFLDVYTNEIESELTAYRIDMAKEEVVQNKTFECEIYYPEYFEDYILLTKNEKHYIVDRNTLEIKFDFSELETEKGSINKYTSSGYRKAAGVYIIDNKAYLLSDNGIKQVDLEKGDVRQLQCTKEMSIKSVYLLDDILYTVTEDALYKININSDNISKLTDIEGTMTSIDKFYMYSHDKGYLMCNYDKDEYEGFIFIKNK